MIPIHLELHNFMAYGANAALDFRGMKLICLSGENGAGKSTLLDAITWALWGKARARRDDELIRHGAEEMWVSFTFSEGQQVYRVIRTRRLTRRGKAISSAGALELFALAGVNEQGQEIWAQLTEPRMADTEAKIINILRLSYETFINSAYLRQGRADEFTIKSPAERKALLGEILNLEVWERHEERAKLALQQTEAHLARLRSEMDAFRAELERLPEYEEALRRAEQQLQAAVQEYEVAAQRLSQIEREEAHAQQLRRQRDQLQQQLRDLEQQLAAIAQQRAARQATIEQQRQRLAQRAQIEAGYEAWLQLQARDAQFNEQLRSLNALNTRKHELESAIQRSRSALENQRSALQAQLRDLIAQTEVGGGEQEMQQLQAQIAASKQAEDDLRTIDDARAEAQAQRQSLIAENEQLRKQGKDLKARIVQLREIGAVCPTCNRPLGDEERSKLLADWHAQGQALNAAYERNLQQAQAIQQRLEQLEAERRAAQQRARALGELQHRLGKLEQRLAQARQAAARLPALREALDTLTQTLEEGSYAADLIAELASVNTQRAQLGYDAAAHEALRAELQRMEVFRKEKASLDDAMRVIEREQVRLEGMAQQEDTLRAHHAQTRQLLEADLQALQACEQTLRDAERVRAAHRQAEQNRKTAEREYLLAQQRVESCRSQRERLIAFEEEHKQLEARRLMLQELREAFSKNGVPAMIIESALPELESIANALLGRMTSGRMGVRFETQRLTQGGKLSETLEIRINDELGERAYEMFSGGEAFRINFAIRVALSHLLARRAGASLQTLFIDEGFGTQDAQGRERLIEAIRAIEDDFHCILIITHIEELKEAFPTRVEVTKTLQGSTMQVVMT